MHRRSRFCSPMPRDVALHITRSAPPPLPLPYPTLPPKVSHSPFHTHTHGDTLGSFVSLSFFVPCLLSRPWKPAQSSRLHQRCICPRCPFIFFASLFQSITEREGGEKGGGGLLHFYTSVDRAVFTHTHIRNTKMGPNSLSFFFFSSCSPLPFYMAKRKPR